MISNKNTVFGSNWKQELLDSDVAKITKLFFNIKKLSEDDELIFARQISQLNTASRLSNLKVSDIRKEIDTIKLIINDAVVIQRKLDTLDVGYAPVVLSSDKAIRGIESYGTNLADVMRHRLEHMNLILDNFPKRKDGPEPHWHAKRVAEVALHIFSVWKEGPRQPNRNHLELSKLKYHCGFTNNDQLFPEFLKLIYDYYQIQASLVTNTRYAIQRAEEIISKKTLL